MNNLVLRKIERSKKRENGIFRDKDMWDKILDIPLKQIYDVLGKDILRYETGFHDGSTPLLYRIVVTSTSSRTDINFVYSPVVTGKGMYLDIMDIGSKEYPGFTVKCIENDTHLILSVSVLNAKSKLSVRDIILKFLYVLWSIDIYINFKQTVIKDFEAKEKKEVANNPMKIITI